LFPQGSRKNPQARFKSGAFYLAEKLNLPVVPMAICGTGKMLPSGSRILHPAKITIKSFPAVYPSDFSGDLVHLKMAQTVKKQIMDFVNSEESK
jgi:1-acyl-sn-glycerol-3-phosphate acyltransferase